MTLEIHRPDLVRALALALALAAGGCASAPGGNGQAGTGVNDPLEPVNRAIFSFNEAADKAVIEPTAKAYRLIPDPIRQALRNFLRNLQTPIILANNLLQGDFTGAQETTERFVANTSLGLGGFIDIAALNGVQYRSADFGQTLGVWGIGDGPYLVLPILGPSNVRDAIGRGVDTYADPYRFLATNNNADYANYARGGVSAIDTREQLIEPVDELRRSSIDYYATVRSLYRQSRAAIISGHKGEQQPEFPVYNNPE